MHNQKLAKKKILVVEDDDECCQWLQIILEDLGCILDVAVNGQEAVDKVKNKTFDVVLMDIRMPVLNGYEAARSIRDMNKDLPIIALTAHALPWIEERYRDSGMNDYLLKPFEKEQLVEKLLKWTNA